MTKFNAIKFLVLSSSFTALMTVPSFAQDSVEDEVIVTGKFIPEPQRATSQVASYLQPEDLVRQGDSTAALALTRLSGLSVVGGKFAYVRGLGDRYSAATLNGSPLPSPDPLRRTVPLDLFPSGILDTIAVQKTYSSNYSGEFGGGVIDMQTKRDAGESYTKIKGSVGLNSETSFQDGLTYTGGDWDFIGYNDDRDLPGPINRLISNADTVDSTNDFFLTTALQNTKFTTLDEDTSTPNFGISVEAGREFSLGKHDVIFTGTAGFDRSVSTKNVTQDYIEATSANLINDIDKEQTTVNSVVNALGAVSIPVNADHTLLGTVLYIHDTDKQASFSEGDRLADSIRFENEVLAWYERELMFSQIGGEHYLGNYQLDWRGSYSESSRDAPYEFSDRSKSYEFSYLDDWLYSAGADLSREVELFGLLADLTVGGAYSDLSRDYASFSFSARAGFSGETLQDEPAVFRETIGTDKFYVGALETQALYGKADIEFSPTVRTEVGLRFEDADQSIVVFNRLGELSEGGLTELGNDYLLPSVSFTWNFMEDTQLRLAYSNTIGRPQFRELAPTVYNDPENSVRTFQGNNNLVDTEFANYDVRLERYFGRNQFFTLAGFYKEIDNPIEDAQFSPSTGTVRTSYINAPKAEISGFETEYRTNFEMPFEGQFFDGKDWLFAVNYTFTDSEIKAGAGDVIISPDGVETNAAAFGIDGATLQGTPENILNAQFGWESDRDQFTVLLGWVDERTLLRGNNVELLDVIEDPGVQLDAVYRRDMTFGDRDVTLGLKARNLLNEKHEEYQQNDIIGRTEFNTYDRGVSVSASLSSKF